MAVCIGARGCRRDDIGIEIILRAGHGHRDSLNAVAAFIQDVTRESYGHRFAYIQITERGVADTTARRTYTGTRQWFLVNNL